jgi:hypothetical protein
MGRASTQDRSKREADTRNAKIKASAASTLATQKAKLRAAQKAKRR